MLCLLTLFCAAGPVLAEDAVNLSGDSWHWYPDDKVKITGNITATYRDYTITSDSVDADLQTNVAVFDGVVKLVTKDHTVNGKQLKFNMKTGDWTVDDAGTQIQLAALPGQKQSEGFIHSAEISGNDKEFKVDSGTFTTCDLEHPHYLFKARSIEIYPNSRIVAHDASMIGLDKHIFTLRNLVIPIRGMRSNLLPQAGSSAEEGMFLKTSYAYTATEKSIGYLKLDLMQKRGVGAGLDHSYKLSTGSGQASIYYLADQQIGGNNITGSIRHEQKLGNIGLDLSADYRTNNYLYFPSSTSQNWQAALNHISSNSNTSLTFRDSLSRSSGFGQNDDFDTSLRHIQQFGSKLSGQLSMDMRSFSSSSFTAADKELNSTIELRQREDKYDLSLFASKRNDLDGSKYTNDDLYSNLDRLPELVFETDSYRLGKNPPLGLPFRLSMSAGRYHEMPGDITSDRLLLQWDMLSRSFDIGEKNDLNLTAGYRQAYYASDAMQYVAKAGGVLTTRYNDYLKTRLNYNYQDVRGYSPFQFDYTGKYHYARLVTDYQDNDKLRWSLSSGYDFRNSQSPWQDMTFRLTSHPSKKTAFSVATGYDINRSKWRSLINQFQIEDPDHISLQVGTRYDMEFGKLGLLRGRIDWKVSPLWRLEGITSWNGITKAFDYKSFRITRDLHCCEVSLSYNDETGFMQNKGFSIDFGIKAFPSADRFGIGQYGQTVDTSMGDYYY